MPDTRSVYFTFPDARLSYECRGCGACCKGLGIGVDAAAGELDFLVDAYPGVAPWVRQRGETWTVFNPRGRCWFLDEAGWCEVERDHGRAKKPASCRLFPFNRVFASGAWLVVDYNAVICPLRALPDDAPEEAIGLSGRVRHAQVLAEIEAVRDASVVGVPLPSAALGDAFWTRERDLAEAIFALDAADPTLHEALFALQRAAHAAQGDPDGARADAGSEDQGDALAANALGHLDEGLATILDGAPASPSATTLRHALLSVPSLRFNEIFGPRDWAPHASLLARLPAMVHVWLRLLGAGESVASRALSMQEVTSTWGEVVALTFTLSLWEEAWTLPAGAVELHAEGVVRERVLRFARACVDNRVAGQPLRALAAPLLEGPPHERVAAFRHLTPLLPRLRPVSADERAAAGSSRTARRRSRKKSKRRR